MTVGEVVAHELAHAVVPRDFEERGRYDFSESGKEGMWVRRQAGQVALDLGLPGANNADHLITRISVNETQGCTVQRPQGDGARDGVLFLDGSRGYNGVGSAVPPGSGSQESINSRRLAADESGQEFSPADSDGPFPLRQLSRVTPPLPEVSRENSGTFDNHFGSLGPSSAGTPSSPSADRPASFDNRFGNWSNFPTSDVGNPHVAPPNVDSSQVRVLGRKIVGRPSAAIPETGALAAPLAPSDDANFTGGLLGRLVALAGIDPRDPTQFAPPPLDDQLRGFYRDDPTQPWFVQRQR